MSMSRDQMFSLFAHFVTLEEKFNDGVKLRRVKIKSNFNGQPYGHSKKSLKGEMFTVKSGFFDGFNGPCLFLDGISLSIRVDDVEFLD